MHVLSQHPFRSEPLSTLAQARAARNQPRLLDSEPELTWIIARCLVELHRFEEARDEAIELRVRYPGDEWTLDLEKHLLINPLGYPSREELQARSPAARRNSEDLSAGPGSP